MEIDGKGHALVKCPDCGRVHHVRNQNNHLNKKSPRVRCNTCGCTWRLKDDEVTKIRELYNITEVKSRKDEPEKGRTLAAIIFGGGK